MNRISITAEELAALIAERDALRGELRVTKVERDLLKEQLKAFERRLFGAKSEARSDAQRDLFLNEAEALAPTAATLPAQEDDTGSTSVAGHKRGKPARKPLDPALPRKVIRYELTEQERLCPKDGSMLVEIGVEVSEQLDIIPQQVQVIRHERVKYACRQCDQGMKVTPARARIIPRGLFTEGALAWFIVSKYIDGLPLYRIAALLRRFGGDISRNTLAASVVRLGLSVQPVINLMRDVMLDSEIGFGDETTAQVLKEPGRAPQTKSYVWVQMNGSGPPVRLFTYAPGRSQQLGADLWVGMRHGAVLMTDGYKPYDTIAKAGPAGETGGADGGHVAPEHRGPWRGRRAARDGDGREQQRARPPPNGDARRGPPETVPARVRHHAKGRGEEPAPRSVRAGGRARRAGPGDRRPAFGRAGHRVRDTEGG